MYEFIVMYKQPDGTKHTVLVLAPDEDAAIAKVFGPDAKIAKSDGSPVDMTGCTYAYSYCRNPPPPPIIPNPFIGHTIVDAKLDGAMVLSFASGDLTISDRGQQCCEHRYTTTDDDVSSLIGAKLVHIIEKPADDVCFVEIQTSEGIVTLTNHNEHNGYYGGFNLRLSWDGENPQPLNQD